MPTYDYRCGHCGHTFELRQGFDADSVSTCPVCHQEARRLFHTATIIYKGSGFYTTDYKHNHVSPPGNSSDGSSHRGSSKGEESPKEKVPKEESPKDESGSVTTAEPQKEAASGEA